MRDMPKAVGYPLLAHKSVVAQQEQAPKAQQPVQNHPLHSDQSCRGRHFDAGRW
jgi:hypothetical protein